MTVVITRKILSEARPTNGWAYVGLLQKTMYDTWASEPKVEITKPSPAPREYPLRIGDQVRVTAAIPQVIIEYSSKKDATVLIAPISLRQAINLSDYYTGRRFSVGEMYEAADVSVAAFPGHDAVVWLRLVTR